REAEARQVDVPGGRAREGLREDLVQAIEQTPRGRVAGERADLQGVLRVALRDRRLVGDEGRHVVEGGDQRLHVGDDGIAVVGDRDHGGAGGLQADGHAREYVADGVALALE